MPDIVRNSLSILLIVLLMAAAADVLSQSREGVTPPSRGESQGEFQFVRLAYSTHQGRRSGFGGRQMWQTDWPDAEHHFVKGIQRLTHIAAADNGQILVPLDENIFDYPWIYAVEVGYWSLSDEEAARLRDYLLRGGFLMATLVSSLPTWSHIDPLPVLETGGKRASRTTRDGADHLFD